MVKLVALFKKPTDPRDSIIGFELVLLGIPAYLFWKEKQLQVTL